MAQGLQGRDPMKVDMQKNDVWLLERLSEAAMRSGHTETAIAGFALSLRLRVDLGLEADRIAEKLGDWARVVISE